MPKFGKRDLFYVTGFLIFIIIALLAFIFGKFNNIIGIVGFTGTVLSIVLAVITIIFTIVESARNSMANQNISITSEKLNISIDELIKASKELKYEEVLAALQEIGKGVEVAKQNITNIADKINNFRLPPMDIAKASDLLEFFKTKENIKPLIDTLNMYDNSTLKVIYLLCMLQDRKIAEEKGQKKKDSILIKFINQLIDKPKPQSDWEFGGILGQMLVIERLFFNTQNMAIRDILKDYPQEIFNGISEFVDENLKEE